MKERTATICGYVLFVAIFLLVVAGVYGIIQSRRVDPALEDTSPPVTISAHIGPASVLYVVAHIKKGHHIYSINKQTPEPIRTVLNIAPSQDFGATGDWGTILGPKKVSIPGVGILEEHEYGTAWRLPINSHVPLAILKIKGTVTVTPCSEDSCCLPLIIPFEAQAVR